MVPAPILGMAPIAFVTMTEHMGHIMVLNKLTKRNFFKDPGFEQNLTWVMVFQAFIVGFAGGPPTTSYGENIGVLAMSKVHSVWVIGGATFFAIVFSFCGKISALDPIVIPKSSYRRDLISTLWDDRLQWFTDLS